MINCTLFQEKELYEGNVLLNDCDRRLETIEFNKPFAISIKGI